MKKLLLALLAVLLAVVLPSSGTMAAAASCSATKYSVISLKATGKHTYHYVQMTDSSHVTTGGWTTLRGPINTGAPTLAVTTCKSPTTGAWSILQATPTNHFYDLTVTESTTGVRAVPRSGSYGWGVFAKRITGNALTLQIRRCVQTPATLSVLGVAHGVLGLPLPVKPAYAVGAWILDKLLPAAPDTSKYYCGDMGTTDFPIGITASTGAAYFANTTRSGTATWRSAHLPCYIMYCSNVWDDTVTVSRA